MNYCIHCGGRLPDSPSAWCTAHTSAGYCCAADCETEWLRVSSEAPAPLGIPPVFSNTATPPVTFDTLRAVGTDPADEERIPLNPLDHCSSEYCIFGTNLENGGGRSLSAAGRSRCSNCGVCSYCEPQCRAGCCCLCAPQHSHCSSCSEAIDAFTDYCDECYEAEVEDDYDSPDLSMYKESCPNCGRSFGACTELVYI